MPVSIREHLKATGYQVDEKTGDVFNVNSPKKVNIPKETTSSFNSKSSPENKQAVLSKWDSEIKPLIEKAGYANQLTYSDVLPVMKFYNGRYKKFEESLKNSDPKIYDHYKQFSSNAEALVSMIKSGKLNNNNLEQIKKYMKNSLNSFNILDQELQASNSYWKINDKQNIVPTPIFEKYFDGVVQMENGTHTKKVTEDLELEDAPDGFLRLKNIEKMHHDRILNMAKPLVQSWTENSIQNINSKVGSADNNKNAHTLAVTLLDQVSQHGTVANKKFSEKNKQEALRISSAIYGKSYDEQLKILKDNSESIVKMSKSLGFYGTMAIYNKTKDTIGKDISFYPSEINGKSKEDYFKSKYAIEYYRKGYLKFKNVGFKKLSDEAKAMVSDNRTLDPYLSQIKGSNSDYNLMSDAILDQGNNIVSFEKWIKTLNAQQLNSSDNKNEWSYNNEIPKHPYNESSYTNSILYTLASPYFKKVDGRLNVMSDDFIKQTLKQVYANLAKGYKRQFDKINAQTVFENSNIAGIGSNFNVNAGFIAIDATLDKGKNLISSTMNKQQNFNKLLSLMKNKNGQWVNDNVIAFSDMFENSNSGKLSTGNPYSVNTEPAAKQTSNFYSITEEQLYNQAKETPNELKKFFSQKDLTDVNMTLLRNTNIPNKVAYLLFNRKTNKSITVFVNKNLVKEKEEHLFKKTAEDPDQFEFELEGEWKMPEPQNIKGVKKYEEATIVRNPKTGGYQGLVKFKDSSGIKNLTYDIPNSYGLSINGAYKLFSEILKNI